MPSPEYSAEDFVQRILQEPDSEQRSIKLSEQFGLLFERLRLLETQLEQEKSKRGEAEELLRINPDTGLPIYRVFYQSLEQLLEKAASDGHGGFVVGVIRLDRDYQRIKNNKDRSKALLFRATIRIREILGDSLYQSDRLDEFFVLLTGEPDSAGAQKVFGLIVKELALPHEVPAEGISFGCFIGFARYPEHGTKLNELIENAEIALRYGTQKSRRVMEFSRSLGESFDRVSQLEQELRNAARSGFSQFHLVYQPIVNVRHEIVGCESLMRWEHPTLGKIPPSQFIPLAERNGEIRILGRWILYKACVQLKEWQGLGFPELFMSVNLSPVQFTQKDMVRSIGDVLSATGIQGHHLKLEITEGTIMDNPEESVRKLLALRDMGIRLSIDDFGTGYSSLNYLRKLPITTLKIDKSFIDDITQNEQNKEIVKAIISMGKSLRMETLAEGVEDADQRDFLFQEGCQLIQGYFYSKPVDPDVFATYLKHGGILPQRL